MNSSMLSILIFEFTTAQKLFLNLPLFTPADLMEDGTHDRVLLLQEAIRRQVIQGLLGRLSPTFMQKRFCTPPCPVFAFSLENKIILKAVKTTCTDIIHFFRYALTISTVTGSFHLSSFNLQNSNTSLTGLHTHHSSFLFYSTFFHYCVHTAKRWAKLFTALIVRANTAQAGSGQSSPPSFGTNFAHTRRWGRARG